MSLPLIKLSPSLQFLLGLLISWIGQTEIDKQRFASCCHQNVLLFVSTIRITYLPMLIPPLQEFDPGTLQPNNGQATMSEILNMASTTSSSTIASAPVPHRYQYTLDVPRILRHLRPLKAKISAIELAIKSAPSYGYSSNNNNNNINTTAINTTDRHERHSRRSRHSRSQDEEQESRPRRGRTEQYYGRHTATSASLHNNETTAANGSSSAKIGRDLLIKRFQHSLTDVFKELIDKYWWQPICDDYDLPLNSSLSKVVSMGINPSQYTLGMTCAFAVGRIIASLPGHQAILVDKYYNIMPESMRRYYIVLSDVLETEEYSNDMYLGI